jgi:hypothetical protein
MSGIRSEVLFRENRFFLFFVFLCFYEVILALENSPEKIMIKMTKQKINSKIIFPEKMAPENTYESD